MEFTNIMHVVPVARVSLYVALAAAIYSHIISSVAGVPLKVQYRLDNGLTCYTCTNKSDNIACNRWAPEKFCPSEHTTCMSVHRFDIYSGRSVQVTKLCTLPSKCTHQNVGCWHIDGTNEMECVSCCTESYCNKAVAVDVYSAIQLSKSLVSINSAVTSSAAWSLMVVTWLYSAIQLSKSLVSINSAVTSGAAWSLMVVTWLYSAIQLSKSLVSINSVLISGAAWSLIVVTWLIVTASYD